MLFEEYDDSFLEDIAAAVGGSVNQTSFNVAGVLSRVTGLRQARRHGWATFVSGGARQGWCR